MDVVTALDRLPKVELHCHVEGTMRPGTVVDLARQERDRAADLGPDRAVPVLEPRHLPGDLLAGAVHLGSRDDWARLAVREHRRRDRHGLVYRETFFTPARHLDAGQDLSAHRGRAGRGAGAARTDAGPEAALIADIDRIRRDGGRLAMVRHSGRAARGGQPGTERVIGVGLDSTELGVDPTDFADAFELAGKSGLRRTSHQGEETPPSPSGPGWTFRRVRAHRP